MEYTRKPVVLIVLDGWGYRTDAQFNAIAQAHTPCWDRLWKTYPHTLLSASSGSVGLPPHQIGNSEVGHLHMGAGRIVPQELVRLNEAIHNGDFSKNPVLQATLDKAQKRHARVHLIGLTSPGGVHSHVDHIKAMANLVSAQTDLPCYIHAILDGRDVPPKSAEPTLSELQKSGLHLASVIGRYYAMDRDKRWKRTKIAYEMLTQGDALYHAATAEEAIQQAYQRGETDEFVKPTLIKQADGSTIAI